MGVYIGFIEKKDDTGHVYPFFNFKPLAELQESKIQPIDLDDSNFLPQSEKRNINFSYDRNSISFMNEKFPNHSLLLFDFELGDLTLNVNSAGRLNQTGYKIPILDFYNREKVRPISTENIYYVLSSNELSSDFEQSPSIDLNASYLALNDDVLVECSDCLAGPYHVGARNSAATFYIRPDIKENNYTVHGCSKSRLITLTSPGSWNEPELQWKIAFALKDDFDIFDRITDTELLDGLKNLSTENSIETPIKDVDVSSVIQQYHSDIFSGRNLSDSIKSNRVTRLVEFIQSQRNIKHTLEPFTNSFFQLLLANKDEPNVEVWLKEVLNSQPDLLNQIPIINEKLDELNAKLAEKQEKCQSLDIEIQKKAKEAASINREAIEEKKQELLRIDTEYQCKQTELADLSKKYNLSKEISELLQQKQKLSDKVSYKEQRKSELDNGIQNKFDNLAKSAHEKMVDFAFDGYLSSKMYQAAAKWESEQVDKSDNDFLTNINNLTVAEKSPTELADYLYTTIHSVRQNYSRNTILNIAICIAQGFLTVFSGEPGCGKTSICNLFAQALGLNRIASSIRSSQSDTGTDFEHSSAKYEDATCINRYIPVSVEKGWTSKRDFIGYYNPLSKTFDQNNSRVYQALRLLDKEARNSIHKLPLLILLDEANLSPMEYYWSDFMNVCDDLNFQGTVNLGEHYIFRIPETLHFLATINNDHTTEVLSPRLIDRAWVITLPEQYAFSPSSDTIPEDFIEIISWNSLRNAFLPTSEDILDFSPSVKSAYEEIISKLKSGKFSVSPRVDRAIRQYWVIASKPIFFESIDGADRETVALDYAVAQRLLPKISGSGENFKIWLTELKSICIKQDLNMSAQILKEMIDRGDQQMNYYQFFC